MDCPECGQWDKEPKRLSCSHSMCVECAQSKIHAAMGAGIQPLIECALIRCSELTPVPDGQASSLPTNLLWKKIQGVYKEYPPMTTETVTCEFCDKNTSIKDMRHCQDCHRYMCAWCEAEHIKNETFKDHSMENMIKVSCKEHKNICEYFCVQCETFLCVMCVHKKTVPCSSHPNYIIEMKKSREEKLKMIQKSRIQMKKELNLMEKDFELDLLDIKAKLQLAGNIRSEIQKHVENLISKIKEKEKELINVVDEWEKPFLGREKEMESRQEMRPLIKELEKSAEEGMKSEIEQMIIAESLIKSSLPPLTPLPPDNNLCTNLRFVPKETVSVGEIQRTTIDFTKTPEKLWETVGYKWGRDVLFTPKGQIVVCDNGSWNVSLYNRQGDLVTSSKDEWVRYVGEPLCVTYDPTESAVIVSDRKGYLTWLSDDLKNLKDRIRIQEGGNAAWGVGVLSDKRLVVGTEDPQTLGIYDRQGQRLRHITHFGNKNQHKVDMPYYIEVLPDDVIVVSMENKHQVVYFSANLECLQIVEVSNPVGLSITPQADIIVTSWTKGNIYHLWGEVGNVQSQPIKQFSREEIERCNVVRSVAMMGNHLAVVCAGALQLYHWP